MRDINTLAYLSICGRRGDWCVMLVTAHGIAVTLGEPQHTLRAARKERTRIRRLIERKVRMTALNPYLRDCQQIATNAQAPNPPASAAPEASDA